jgi:MarR family transcriptional regulator for hemolysin
MNKSMPAGRAGNESARSNLRLSFGIRLGVTSRHWRRAVDEQLRPFGLTEATWLPLLYLSRGNAPMRQKDLAAQVGIESSTLVRLIDALDQAGWIERQADDDRRAKILCLTRRGRSVVKRVEAAAAKVRQRILANVTDEELAITLNVIDRVCAALTDAYSPISGDEL